MRRPLSSRLALILGAGAILCGTAPALVVAQAASGSDVYVDTRALDQLGYTAANRPAGQDRLKLKPPADHGHAALAKPAPAAPAPAAAAPQRQAALPAAPTQPAPQPKAEPPAAAPPARASAPAAPAPAAPAPPVAASPAAPSRTAALAAPPAAQRRSEARITFPAGATDLPANARGELDQAVRRLAGDDALRLQLNAYAAETPDQPSQARRVSLSRALAVRAYLIDKGVRSTRLDVRALGKPQDGGPADRVDLVVMGR